MTYLSFAVNLVTSGFVQEWAMKTQDPFSLFKLAHAMLKNRKLSSLSNTKEVPTAYYTVTWLFLNIQQIRRCVLSVEKSQSV